MPSMHQSSRKPGSGAAEQARRSRTAAACQRVHDAGWATADGLAKTYMQSPVSGLQLLQRKRANWTGRCGAGRSEKGAQALISQLTRALCIQGHTQRAAPPLVLPAEAQAEAQELSYGLPGPLIDA